MGSIGGSAPTGFLGGDIMVHHLPLRLLVCAALAGSASLGAVIGAADTASGATAPLTVTCTTLWGNGVKQTLSGCTGTGAITADAGKSPTRGSSLLSTMMITWSNGKRTHENYTYSVRTATKDTCAAKAKYTKVELVTEQGRVGPVGTTTKGMVNGAIRANVCVYKLTAAPHTITVVNQGKITI
jgi:hypothetical protein